MAKDTHERWANDTYERLAETLRTRAGLVFQSLRRPAVEHAAAHVMERIGIVTPEAFVPLVAQDGAVFDDLMAEVTIGETYFFREPGHFAVLRERVFPEFKAAVGEKRRFRAWSAAASTGEEPYSIAIAMREQGIDGDVLGTDISRARLSAARRGTYRKWSFRGVPEETLERYFRATGDSFTLASEIRRDVDFRYLNLASDCYPAMSSGVWGMDVIFCRNVLIYFDRDTIEHVAKSLLDSLSDDGWIFLGATDPPLSDYVACQVVQTPTGLVYRRPGAKSRGIASGVTKLAPIRLRTEPAAPPPPARADLQGPLRYPIAPPIPEVAHVPSSGISRALEEPAGSPATVAAQRVRELANAGRLEEAGRECAAALDIYRDAPELHYLHAILVAQARQFAESARAARRALYFDRTMIVAHTALGTALAKSGDIAAARRAFESAVRLLASMPADATVPYSGGEPAGRLLEMTRLQHRLAGGEA